MTRLLCFLFGHDPVAGLDGELVCLRCYARTAVKTASDLIDQSWTMFHAEAVEGFESEVERLRKGLWDTWAVLGYDTDGCAGPGATIAGMGVDGFIRMVIEDAATYRRDAEEEMERQYRETQEAEAALARVWALKPKDMSYWWIKWGDIEEALLDPVPTEEHIVVQTVECGDDCGCADTDSYSCPFEHPRDGEVWTAPAEPTETFYLDDVVAELGIEECSEPDEDAPDAAQELREVAQAIRRIALTCRVGRTCHHADILILEDRAERLEAWTAVKP